MSEPIDIGLVDPADGISCGFLFHFPSSRGYPSFSHSAKTSEIRKRREYFVVCLPVDSIVHHRSDFDRIYTASTSAALFSTVRCCETAGWPISRCRVRAFTQYSRSCSSRAILRREGTASAFRAHDSAISSISECLYDTQIRLYVKRNLSKKFSVEKMKLVCWENHGTRRREASSLGATCSRLTPVYL